MYEKWCPLSGQKSINKFADYISPRIGIRRSQIHYYLALLGLTPENLQRKDVDPIDIAQGLRKLKEMLRDATMEELGKRVGLDRTNVWRYLSLLGLTPELQEMVSEGKLTISPSLLLV